MTDAADREAEAGVAEREGLADEARALNEELEARALKDLTPPIGAHVRHLDSGWTGVVTEVRDDDTPMRGTQGLLVTVRPTYPRPADAGPDWQGWAPITVTAAELVVED